MKTKIDVRYDLSMVFDREEYERLPLWFIKDGILKYESSELIIAYYQNLKHDKEKGIVIEILKENLTRTNVSGLAFATLYLLGYGNDAIEHYENTLSNIEGWHHRAQFVSFIEILIYSDLKRFDHKELLRLKEIIERYYDEKTKKNIIHKIVRLRYEQFEKSIQGINTEINNDKKMVQQYLKDFGFEEKYNITLNKLDQYIQNEQGEGEVVPGGVIGILREFSKNFFIDVAMKIAHFNHLDKIPDSEGPTTDIGHARKYIEKEFGLSSADSKFLDSFKDILNDSGSHALLSEKKYLRLTRNIGIEIYLFILEKLSGYLNKK